MDRKTFLKSLVVLGAAVPCGRIADAANDGLCGDANCMTDAGAVRKFLSDFLLAEEKNLDRAMVVKLPLSPWPADTGASISAMRSTSSVSITRVISRSLRRCRSRSLLRSRANATSARR